MGYLLTWLLAINIIMKSTIVFVLMAFSALASSEFTFEDELDNGSGGLTCSEERKECVANADGLFDKFQCKAAYLSCAAKCASACGLDYLKCRLNNGFFQCLKAHKSCLIGC